MDPITVSTGVASSALAFVGGQVSDPGTLYVLIAVIGIPLTFYVAKKVIGLFPKR